MSQVMVCVSRAAACGLTLWLGVAAFCFADDRAEVLIYYACETSLGTESVPDPNADKRELENLAQIIGWLREAKFHEIGEQISLDRWRFPAVVDLERADLDQAEKLKSGPLAGIVFVTNRSIRKGGCECWARPGKFESLPLSLASTGNFLEDGNPLCRGPALREVLQLAARRFDPSKHTFVLVTKGHGDDERVLIPRVVFDTAKGKERLLELAKWQQSNPEEPAGKPLLTSELYGISKAEYLAILEAAGNESGMTFSLVFVESCYAHNGQFCSSPLPACVDLLVATRGTANYMNILYGDALDLVVGGQRLSDAMISLLSKKFVVVTPPAHVIPIEEYRRLATRATWMDSGLHRIPLILCGAIGLAWGASVVWRRQRRERPVVS